MRRAVRFLSAILVLIMLFGSLPIITINAAEDDLVSPFDLSKEGDMTGNAMREVTNLTLETIGNTALYGASLKSASQRKTDLYNNGLASSSWNAQVFDGVKIAVGGKLFVYSKSSNGDFEANSLPDIAKQFEADHPEWKVAIVANGTFFDNETSKTSDKGEPEDPYTEDGRIYKTYFEQGTYDSNGAFKTGRGLIGLSNTNTLDANNSVIYHTFEKGGTSYYTGSTPLEYNNSKRYSGYYLEVLGENGNGVVYEYPMYAQAEDNEFVILNYMVKPIFLHEGMTRDLTGAIVYKMKVENSREPHVTVDGVETGVTHQYYDGNIEAIVNGTSSMTVPTGYVYIVVGVNLPYISAGSKVRINKRMADTAWADTDYVFAYKQQILHEGNALFEKVAQDSYGGEVKFTTTDIKSQYADYHVKNGNTIVGLSFTEDLAYGSYGSNRTAIGFKEDGTPVIIVSPRKIFYNDDGKTVKAEASPTYNEMAWYMKALGCDNAFMMDCGDSSQMYKKNVETGEYELLYQDPISGESKVANALILAYPSGLDVEMDGRADVPELDAKYITPDVYSTWYEGTTEWRKQATKNETSFNLATKLASSTTTVPQYQSPQKRLTIIQQKTTYTFRPGIYAKPTNTTYSNSSSEIPVKTTEKEEAYYTYTDLGYTVGEGKRYTYRFKLRSNIYGGYTPFLFADTSDPNSSTKMLNDFYALMGSYSNLGDTNRSFTDIMIGLGRGNKDVPGDYFYKENLKLYIEESSKEEWMTDSSTVYGLGYSLYRIDIDGLNFTVKCVGEDGRWKQLGGTYTLPEGARLVMGYAAWSGAFESRSMSVKDPVIVDLTELGKTFDEIDALNPEEYTAESWAELQKARDEAALFAELPYQNVVNSTATNLAQAQTQIVTRESVLEGSISDYDNYDSKIYTPETWAKFQAAYEAAAQAIANKDYANMEKLNTAYIDARNGLVVQPVSIDLTWQEMDFVYTAGESTWDPETHTDTATGGSWQAKDNSNLISITNNTTSNLSVGLDFTLASEFSGVSGKFYDGSTQLASTFVIAAEDSKDIMLELEGAIPNTTTDRTKGGTVKITVSKISQ